MTRGDPCFLPVLWLLSSFYPMLSCMGHHPGTEDTTSAGSQQVEPKAGGGCGLWEGAGRPEPFSPGG